MSRPSNHIEPDYVKNGPPPVETETVVEGTAINALARVPDSLKQALADAFSAGPERFEVLEADLWKPEKKGEQLRGVYMGARRDGKFLYFHIATMARTGEPMVKRVIESAMATREIQRGAVGQGILITYEGEQKVDEGTMKVLTVAWLKK